jgi:hypothetical protein
MGEAESKRGFDVADYVFHIGEGPNDFSATASMWPGRYGAFAGNQSAASCIVDAIRSGSLIMMRDRADDRVVGATVLDYLTSARSIYVRFNLIREDEKDRASILRAQIEMVIKLLILKKLNRLVVYRDQDIAEETAIAEFNKLAQSYGIPMGVEILGTVRDLFGDGRKVSLTSVFIQRCDRPDLVSNVVKIAKTTADSAIRSVRGLGLAAEICSGCKESKEKESDKEPGKGEKGEKDGKELEITKLALEVEATNLFQIYNQVGIQRFNRYNRPNHFSSLV